MEKVNLPSQTTMIKIRNKKCISNLERVRTFRGLSQQELSSKSGISIRMIQSFEQLSRNIYGTHISNLCALSLALECQIENLLQDTKLVDDLKIIKSFSSIDNDFTENIYPQNLLNDIFDKFVPIETFPNFEKTLEYLFLNMPEKWVKCIKLRYNNNYTYEKIGSTLNITRARVEQLIKKTILELKTSENIKCIELGVEQYKIYLKDKEYKTRLEKANRNLYQIPINELQLSGRAYNCLMRNGIDTIGKLSELEISKLIFLRNMSTTAAKETKGKLEEFIRKRNLI